MNKKSLLITISLLINLSFQVNAKAENNPKLLELGRNISLLEKKVNSSSEKLQLAKLYKNSGNDEKAMQLCSEILSKDPNNSAAIYLVGDIKRRNYDLPEAKTYFNKIPAGKPEYKSALIRLMEISGMLKDRVECEAILARADKKDIVLYNTLEGIYNYSSIKLNPKAAKVNFEKVIEKNPNQLESLYYLGSLYLDESKFEEARKYFNKAIEQDFYFSNTHALMGYLEGINKNTKASIEQLKLALQLNPMDLRALTSHGNGMTEKTYADLEKDNINLHPNEEFFSAGRQAVQLINQGKTSEAKNLINQLQSKYPNNIHTYIQAGSFYITIRDYKEAISMYKKALKINNDYGVANNGLSVAIRELVRSNEKDIKTLNLNTEDYSKIDMNNLKKVFINYDDLTEDEKKVLAFSIYQLKNYIPVLAEINSTHYLIPLYEKSTDYKFGQEFKNTRSFDQRLWDDIRGRGGLNSATGIEDLHSSLYLDFNTLSHEFAHQVHQYAFTNAQKNKISSLYENAQKNKLFLDYYAGSNEYEYFAQGIEAYRADQGKMTLKSTGKNTKEFLKTKDKDLYDFIETTIAKTDMKDNQAAAYVRDADNSYFEGNYTKSINGYKKAIEIMPDNMDYYYLLANVYFQNGNLKESIDNYNKIIKNDPQSSYSYFGIASNYFLLGKFEEAKQDFEKALKIDKLSVDGYAESSRTYLEMGNLNEADKLAQNAIDFDKDNSSGFSSKSLVENARLNFQNALLNADKAIELDPGNNLYKIRKAYILASSGATIKAYQAIKEVSENYETNPPVRYEYNEAKKRYYYYNMKDIPTKAEYYYTMGYISEIDNNISDSVKYYQKTIELLPYMAKTYKRLQGLIDNKKVSDLQKRSIEQSISDFNKLTQGL